MISRDEVSRPGQFVGQGIMSHTGIGLIQFPVIEVAAKLMGLSGMIRSLGESPGEVAIPVPGIAFALGLFITGPAAGNLPAIGGIMTDAVEPFNGSRFQENGHPQDVSYPRKGEQLGKRFFQPDPASDRRLDPLDLAGEEVNRFFAGSACKGKLFLILEKLGHGVLGQLLEIIGTDLDPVISHHDVLEAQYQGSTDSDQVRPLPQ